MIIAYTFGFLKIFLCCMNETNLNSKSLQHDLMLFLQIMQINFSRQDNAIFLPSVIIKKITSISCLTLCFDLYASMICLVLYGKNKILRAVVLLFCSNFFQSFEPDGKSISSPSYWSIKVLAFFNALMI